MRQVETSDTTLRAVAVAAAPVVLAVGLVAHPYLADPLDRTELGRTVAADTTLWGLAHVTVAAGSALIALAFLAIRSFLRDAGEDRWSAPALPLVVAGSVLFAVLPGIELAPMAAADAGGDPAAVQRALDPWFIPILATASLTFGLGVLGFARAIQRADVLSRPTARMAATALVILAVVRFVPLSIAQLYVHAAAAIIALWPIAYRMWRRPAALAARSAPHLHATRAT